MRRWMILLALATMSVILVACGSSDPRPREAEQSESNIGLFDWSRDPSTIIARLDSQYSGDSAADRLNTIPHCTLWGDGRVVWVTQDEFGKQDVLEARASDAAIRTFLEDIISRGFYMWEDDLVPANMQDTVDQAISVFLYDELRTVRRYNAWEGDHFNSILAACQQLSTTPVQVLPWGGWLSAYPIERDDNLPHWFWPEDAPFTPADLVANGEARWVRGDLVTQIWQLVRDPANQAQVIGPDGSAYELALAVPTISRDAASPPPGEDQPLPTPSPALTPGAALLATAEPAS